MKTRKVEKLPESDPLKPDAPPRILEELFKRLSPPIDRENLVGDHREVFMRKAADRGRGHALKWYLGHILRLIPLRLEEGFIGGSNMFKNYLKVALRSFGRHKGFSLINLFGLAVGMACAILIGLWVRYESGFDRFFTKAGRLHQVVYVSDSGEVRARRLQGPLAAHLKANFPEIVDATVYFPWRKKLVYQDQGIFSDGAYVQPSFFRMFDFPFVSGRPEEALAAPDSIIITEKLAQRLFGGEDPMGKTVRYFAYTEGIDLRVAGVMQDLPANTHFQFEFLISHELGFDSMKTWDNKCLFTYVELSPSSSREEVDKKIAGEVKRNKPGSVNNLYLQPLTDIHLRDLKGGGRITYIYVFSVMAFVILLIAGINFTNLSTARSEIRFREIGVRKVLGSERGQLIRQFLTESIFTAFLALGLALLLVIILIPSISRLLDADLHLHLGGPIVPALLGMALLTGAAAGIYPAFFLSGFHPVSVLKGQAGLGEIIPGRFGGKAGTRVRGSLLRRGLVLFQFTLTIIFIIAIFVIFRQMNHIRNRDLGYDRQHVVVIPLTGDLQLRRQLVKEELLRHPSVLSATMTLFRQEMWESATRDVSWPGKPPELDIIAGNSYVDFDYIKTFKMEMAFGRFFSPEFPSEGRGGVVINEAMARTMGLTDAVGKTLIKNVGSSSEQEMTIIGVVKDYHTQSLHSEIRPFFIQLSGFGNYLYIRMDGRNISAGLDFIRSKIRELVPGDPVAYQFLDERIEALYSTERMVESLVRYGTFIALIIACLGLFGLAAFSVERRTKEIGIRKILGASTGRVSAMLTGDLLKWVLPANLLAWPVSYLIMRRWLQGFAYRIGLRWDIFIIAAAASFLIAALTIIWQSMKAALADPVDSLRYE